MSWTPPSSTPRAFGKPFRQPPLPIRPRSAEVLVPHGAAEANGIAADHRGHELDAAEFDPARVRQAFPATPLADLPPICGGAGAARRGRSERDSSRPPGA